jgi:hypothetical protein
MTLKEFLRIALAIIRVNVGMGAGVLAAMFTPWMHHFFVIGLVIGGVIGGLLGFLGWRFIVSLVGAYVGMWITISQYKWPQQISLTALIVSLGVCFAATLAVQSVLIRLVLKIRKKMKRTEDAVSENDEEEESPFCYYCGADLGARERICPSCGKTLSSSD